MANPEPKDSDDIVHGKDLITRGLDFLFGKAGDAIHGATTKNTTQGKDQSQATKDGKAPNDAPPIEAEGSEVSAPDDKAPPQVA